MFKHLVHDNWVDLVPIVSFVLTAFVFFTMMLRAFVMKKSEAERLAQLAVDETVSNPKEQQS